MIHDDQGLHWEIKDDGFFNRTMDKDKLEIIGATDMIRYLNNQPQEDSPDENITP